MDECQDLKFSGFGGTPGMSGSSMDVIDRLPTEGDDAPDDTWGDIDAAQAPSMR